MHHKFNMLKVTQVISSLRIRGITELFIFSIKNNQLLKNEVARLARIRLMITTIE